MERVLVSQYLNEQFAAGFTDTSRVVGFHGTSLEAVKQLITTGNLPANTIEDRRHIEVGDLFFVPIQDRFPNFPTIGFMEDPLAEAVVYANLIAKRHFLMVKLGLDFTNLEQYSLALELAAVDKILRPLGKALEICQRDGFNIPENIFNMPRTDLQVIIDDSDTKRGVVLGLSESILDHFQPEPGDSGGMFGDMKINCPEGLSYEFIKGIKVLGVKESDLFRSMINQYDSK